MSESFTEQVLRPPERTSLWIFSVHSSYSMSGSESSTRGPVFCYTSKGRGDMLDLRGVEVNGSDDQNHRKDHHLDLGVGVSQTRGISVREVDANNVNMYMLVLLLLPGSPSGPKV